MQFHVAMSKRGFPVFFYEEERDGRQYWVRRPFLSLSSVIVHINMTREETKLQDRSWAHSYSFDIPRSNGVPVPARFASDHRPLNFEEMDRVNRQTLPGVDHYWIGKSLEGRLN